LSARPESCSPSVPSRARMGRTADLRPVRTVPCARLRLTARTCRRLISSPIFILDYIAGVPATTSATPSTTTKRPQPPGRPHPTQVSRAPRRRSRRQRRPLDRDDARVHGDHEGLVGLPARNQEREEQNAPPPGPHPWLRDQALGDAQPSLQAIKGNVPRTKTPTANSTPSSSPNAKSSAGAGGGEGGTTIVADNAVTNPLGYFDPVDRGGSPRSRCTAANHRSFAARAA
jgi:hypothetical protein